MRSEENNRLYIYYLITAAIFLLLKIFHSEAGTEELLILIKPVSQLIGIVTGSTFIKVQNSGYYFESLNIIIDKSCSGFNFACLTFLILNFLAFKYIFLTKLRILVFPVSLLYAYFVTILVNSSRIILALLLESRMHSFDKNISGKLHLAEGIFVYLFFLILIYIVTDFVLSKIKQKYELNTLSVPCHTKRKN